MKTSENMTMATSESLQTLTPRRVLLVAGEASSDLHGAAFARELLARGSGAVEIFGMGGSAMREAGVSTIVDSEHSASVMGLTEVLTSLRKILNAFKTLVAFSDNEKLDLAVLVDFPDFNLRLAKALRKRGVPVLYFISPQLWAWRSGRVKAMRRDVSKVAAIFPFEESFYHKHGVPAEYVGHPLVGNFREPYPRDKLYSELGIASDRSIIALLPGSRKAEIERLLPPLLSAAKKLSAYRSELTFVLPVAPGVHVEQLEQHAGGSLSPVQLYHGPARNVLMNAKAAVVASGTATVEAALAQCPTIAVYKMSALTYRIARYLVRGVRHFAMPNLIAGERVVTELLQDEVTGERIAESLESLLGDPARLQSERDKLRVVRDRLESSHSLCPAARTAEIALELMADAASPNRAAVTKRRQP